MARCCNPPGFISCEHAVHRDDSCGAPCYKELEEQLAAISSRRDELEKWYSEHVAATAQLRDDLAAAQKFLAGYRSCTLRDQIADLTKQLDAANARIKELETTIEDMRNDAWEEGEW